MYQEQTIHSSKSPISENKNARIKKYFTIALMSLPLSLILILTSSFLKEIFTVTECYPCPCTSNYGFPLPYAYEKYIGDSADFLDCRTEVTRNNFYKLIDLFFWFFTSIPISLGILKISSWIQQRKKAKKSLLPDTTEGKVITLIFITLGIILIAGICLIITGFITAFMSTLST